MQYNGRVATAGNAEIVSVSVFRLLTYCCFVAAGGRLVAIMTVFRISLYYQCHADRQPTWIRVSRQQSGARCTRPGAGPASGTAGKIRYRI